MKKRKIWSGLLCIMLLVAMLPAQNVMAEENYPYMIFAASSQAGAVTIESQYLCANGDIATNGTVVASVDLENIGGDVIENADIAMVDLKEKLAGTYFSSDFKTYEGDYSSDEMNQDIKQSFAATGQMHFDGNVNLDAAIKAETDIVINGQNMNANDCVIYSASGDIIIDCDNVSLTGLLYAPEGNIVIKSQGMNLNRVILIAHTVSLECPSINMNYNTVAAKFIGDSVAAWDTTDTTGSKVEEEVQEELEEVKKATYDVVEKWEASGRGEQLRNRLISFFDALLKSLRSK